MGSGKELAPIAVGVSTTQVCVRIEDSTLDYLRRVAEHHGVGVEDVCRYALRDAVRSFWDLSRNEPRTLIG